MSACVSVCVSASECVSACGSEYVNVGACVSVGVWVYSTIQDTEQYACSSVWSCERMCKEVSAWVIGALV